MQCEDAREQLTAYILGDLAPGPEGMVRTHLAACRDCQAEARQIEATLGLLGDALAGSGASVMVVRPGFVRTSMTAGMPDGPMATTAEAVADDIVAGLARGAHTVWSPAKLRLVFTILRHLPRPLWRKVAAKR